MSIVTVSILVLICIILIILLTSVIKLNAFASLFLVSLLLAVVTLYDRNIIDLLKTGFGNTMASIGFLIILGAIIAVVLEKSGGAIRIAEFILKKTGKNKAAAAMGLTGFLAGMPIFCDSGYIILSGLIRSFSVRAGISLSFVAFVLATSLYSVHCLVPIHPGALAGAGIVGANIGNMILAGILFAIPATIAAYLWVRWRTKKEPTVLAVSAAITKKNTGLSQSPNILLSFLPVIVPILLIAGGSLFDVLYLEKTSLFSVLFKFLGQPVIALLVGVLISFFLLPEFKVTTLNEVLESAIAKAGPILIVTAAGGMFGMVIKETGVGAYAGEHLLKTGLGISVPFLIAFLLKTAQGSSTVAIITAASLVSPMLSDLGLDSETGKLLAMLAMGAGSMMISHANDSYFWVVSRFSGVDVNTTLKIYSTATVIMGLTVFICVWVTSLFLL